MLPTAKYDPRYLEGIDRFNRGDYFDAHEVWEDLWHDCQNVDQRFYQSLIQAAVALYHLRRGNRAGAERLAMRGRAKAEHYPDEHLGLRVREFWQDVAAVVANGEPDFPARRIVLIPAATFSGPNHGTEND